MTSRTLQRPRKPVTLVDLCRRWALEQPDRRAFTFLLDGEAEGPSLTWSALDRRARAVAAALQREIPPGERALLLYPPGLELVAGFLGCLYAGVVAVPAYPPTSRRHHARLRTLLADAGPRAILTEASLRSRSEELASAPEAGGIAVLATGALPDELADEWRAPGLTGDDLAFLQYTSGSTSQPKGVMVSHGNLLHNEEMIRRAFGQSAESVVVSWLPLYHDMGLIGGVLQPLSVGGSCVLMAPVAFLQRPARWLEAIARYRATTSGGPDFAYDLCARRIDPAQAPALDLSSWRVAFNGAEPVRSATLERFARTFAPWGFRREAFYPCYGLAEATLFVSGGALAEPPTVAGFGAADLERHRAVPAAGDAPGGRELVGCGRAWGEQRIAVVDPETGRRCAPGRVGEIWVTGGSVARGYWNRPEESAASFRAPLAGTSRTFLRTGDLGFVRDGELFVTGRLKDLIILRGRNHYPQDVEATVEASHPDLRPGACAAFAVEVPEEGGERLVVACEVDRRSDLRRTDPEEIAAAVRAAVAEEHEAQVAELVLLRAGTIPKTSSGKIRRHACRAGYLGGTLAVVGRSRLAGPAPGTAQEAPAPSRDELFALAPAARAGRLTAWLRDIAAHLVGASPERLGAETPLSSLGLDSLMAVDLRTRLELDLGVDLSVADLLQSPGLGALARELATRLEAAAPPPAPAPREAGDILPLSYGQRSLWLLHQMAPASPHQNLVLTARVHPAGDAAALRRTLQALADRHAALRTTYGAVQGDPVQRIHPHLDIPLDEVDAAGFSSEELEARAAELAYRPFDLEAGPLLRAGLFRQAPGGGDLLVLATHHIALDFWSFVLLLEELQALYPAAVRGETAALPAMPAPAAQYPDFVLWQEELLSGPAGERLWSYWRERLAGELPHLALPTDRPRRPARGRQGGSVAFALGAERTARLKALARERGTTLYSVLLAAFGLLLQRGSGQDEVLVGSPAAGRSAARIAGAVGYVMNPLVLRLDLAGDPPLAALLERVAGTVLGALEHQDFPSHLLAERLHPDRRSGHAALFEVMFVLNRAHRPGQAEAARLALGESGGRVRLAGLELEPYRLGRRWTDFDLHLAMVEAEGEVAGSLVYDADLFDAATAARMAGHLAALLDSCDSARRLSELSLLSPAERQQVLLEWNDAGTVEDEPLPVHRRIAEQARRRPDAVAVAAPGHTLTYAGLDRRAGALAHRLQGLGVGPETRVALFLERSPELIVALLGVLQAGAAYVPVDPAYPQERVAFLLDDARTSVVLTQERLRGRLPETPARVLCLDAGDLDATAEPLGDSTSAWSLAYVLYTSGSLGRPKGVLVEHGSLATYTATAAAAYGVGPADRVLQFASIGFDTSAEEIYPCLTTGATLVLRTEAMLRTMDAFVAGCREQEVTLLDLPTAFWHEWVASLDQVPEVPPAVRLVILGGERARPEQVAAWRARVGSRPRLVNTYGPTEGTIVATMGDLSGPADSRDLREVPIGRPVRAARALLLDRGGRPAPIGVPGELHIAGAGVARGYLGRPDLTAERFVPDPFSPRPGARLYRTGDLALHRPDGSVEFAGRVDHQVKIRGFRVEPGEIETALGRHAGVREAAVVAREDAPGQLRLVAYVVPTPEETEEVTPAALRRHLQELLPDYMVPAAFVLLDSFPLTGSGKVDRRALPAPVPGAAAGAEGFAAPRTAVEEMVAGVCAEVLGLERIGIHDDFFELGCHSLLAMKIVARLRDSFRVELPLLDLFESPTVAQLAAQIEEAAQSESGKLPPIERAPRDQELPLTFPQERIWFLTQLDPNLRSYHVPRALRVRGAIDPALVATTFSEIVRRHEILRTTFPAVEGRPVQIIHPPFPMNLPLVDLSALPEAVRERELPNRILEEGRRPFDLVTGPLLRLTLFRLGTDEHALVMTEHHLVHDGWTQGVLLRDFLTIYGAFAQGRPSPLPELPVQYADFAVWQRRLEGAPAVLDLPADRPRPPVQSFRGDQVTWVLPAPLSRSLRAQSRRLGATLFMSMLSAWDTLLMRLGGQEDLCIGTGVANRRVVEVEGLLGMVINTLVLRADLSGDPTFAALVARMREVCVGAYGHQDLPFEKLVAALRLERTLSHTPLFQVFFAFMDTPMPELELPGLSFSVLDAHNRSAKFEVNVTVLLPSEQRVGLQVGSRQDEITLLFEYSTDIFERPTVLRVLEHFQVLLEAAVADPERRLSELPLLTAAEIHQLLAEANDAAAPFPAERCLHELVFAQAARTPGALAVRCGAERLTYAELAGRAGHLAARLCARGVGPGDLVGLCVERSAAMLPALLGVLAAGAAYVPLDPAYPRERLALMVEDAGLALLLAEERLAGALPAGAPVLFLEAAAAEPAGTPPAARPLPEDLAYVIYTSGSTGRPKGVAIPHRAAVNFLAAVARTPGLAAGDALLALTTLSFDIAVLELFLPLTVGAAVVVATRETARSGADLVAALEDPEITTVQATPATWRLLLESGWAGNPRLKALCGGEALPRDLADRLLGCCGELWNMYGPTETTVWSATWRVAAGPGPVSVGRPLGNTTLHVLDRGLAPLSAGAPGELWIGGAGLARGYLRRPDLTAAAFRPDPFAASPGARLYRTGDLARRLPGGTVEVLGRIDHQVKVRGFRIELGEIEAHLARHPAVGAVAAAVRELAPGDRRVVAYMVPTAAAEKPAPDELRRFLAASLPEHMLPGAWVWLDALPLTPNGKVDRKALPLPGAGRAERAAAFVAPRTELEQTIAAIWREVLQVERVGAGDNFFDLGGHSLLVTRVHARLREATSLPVALLDLFRHPTVGALARHLAPEAGQAPTPARARARRAQAREDAVAIVGMAGRFPGARDLAAFWRNLREGVESISFFSREELERSGVDPRLFDDPAFVPAKSVLEDPEWFAATFFEYTPREAELMNPQQRVFLECAWHALEDAGYDPGRGIGGIGAIGCFAGGSLNGYWVNLERSGALAPGVGLFQAALGNDKDFLATRVAYKLDLKGPAVTVQSACSTALVAVHMAARSLLAGECDMALAGGVSVTVPLRSGYLYQEGMIYSPDGHCRAFDAAARGTVFGNGVGVVVLKPLADALRDGDRIRAVIRGTAINNDGAAKIGFTAPSVEGQAAVIRAAQEEAGVDPRSVTYVEAHGTGTPLGDPIEIAALTEAFATREQGFCAVGSVKTNVGHLDACAGAAGLIKTVLMLEHGEIPPTLHFERPNPEIPFAGSPFFVSAGLRPWQPGPFPRRAGVSAFGLGGTNAHVVLEEAPAAAPSGPARPWQLLLLSARTPTALDAATANLARHLESEEVDLADAAFTLQAGRRAFGWRRAVVCRDRADAAAALLDPARAVSGPREASERPVAFFFPGLGDHYAGMARELYEAEQGFAAEIDRCAGLLQEHLGLDIREALFAPEAQEEAEAPAVTPGRQTDLRALLRRTKPAAGDRPLARTELAQPALFAVEYALARLLMGWGIRPRAMIGYSLGEYVAACLSGVLSLEDALALVARRARLIQGLPGGAMLAVPLPAAELLPLLGEELSLAATNGPCFSVASGPEEAIAGLERQLAERGVTGLRLTTTHAFHSRMMRPAAAALTGIARSFSPRAPGIPYVSNATGTWITAGDLADPGYWAHHMVQPVRFAEGLAELLREPELVLLEVGPGSTLTSLVRQHPEAGADRLAVATLRRESERGSDLAILLEAVGRLWTAGVPLDPAGFFAHERRRRVALPLYPFERQRCWIELRSEPADRVPRALPAATGLDDWFYAPVWKQSPPVRLAGRPEPDGTWLVLARPGFGMRALERLRERGASAVAVEPGDGFRQLAADRYAVAPADPRDHAALLAELRATGRKPARILHLWCAGGELGVDQAEELGFWSLLALAQGLEEAGIAGPLGLAVVTDGVQAVTGDEPVRPDKALVLGPARVIPRELPHVSCLAIDVALPPAGSRQEEALIDSLIADTADAADLGSGRPAAPHAILAYRGRSRWALTYERITLPELPPGPEAPLPLRRGGTYLLTGGLGGMSLELGRFLAREYGARLVLLGRSPLPPRGEWEALLARGDQDRRARRVRKVQELESMGAEVLVLAADVTDREAMRRALAEARSCFGPLHGVVHAAGVPGGGIIQRKTPAMAREVLAPKVEGMRVLDELLAGEKLDFLALCSSMVAVVGLPGRADYCSANGFLDAYAHRRAALGGPGHRVTVAIDWDTWREVGMAVEAGGQGPGSAAEGRGLSTAEGVEAFRRALAAGAAGLSQVLVSLDDPASLEEQVAAFVAGGADARAGRLQAGPAGDAARPRSGFVAPRTEAERIVAGVFAELLGTPEIGALDDFFALGGDSLVATQAVSRLRRAFGVELPLERFFSAATVAALAEEAVALGFAAQPARSRPIERAERAEPPPMSFAQERFWSFRAAERTNAPSVIPVALRAAGALDVPALFASLRAVMERHEVLRTTYAEVDGRPVQVIRPPGEPSATLVDLSGLAPAAREAEALRLAAAAGRTLFDFARGPLLAGLALRLAERDHLLVLAFHHVLFDGWSSAILAREMAAVYTASAAGRAPVLPPLPIQYADFAAWQRQVLAGDALQTQLDWWREHLRPPLSPVLLPTPRPRPAARTYRGARLPFALSAGLTRALRAFSLREDATLFMTLLAGYDLLLAAESGQEDLTVLTFVASRNRFETEGLIGNFFNILALRTWLAGDEGFRELLARVRTVTLGAYAYQDLPFEKVTAEVAPLLSEADPFRVGFALNLPVLEVELPDLALEPLEIDTGRTWLELMLVLREEEGRLAGFFRYNTDLFDAAAVRRLGERFTDLLERALAAPDRPLVELMEPAPVRAVASGRH